MKFEEAAKSMSKFIKSKDFLKNAKEEAPEIIPFIPTLTNINKNGLITVDSQPGKRLRGENFDLHQRAYLLGFMESEKAIAMNQSFAFEDKVMIIVHVDETATMEDFKSKMDIPLTIEASSAEFKVVTHTSASVPQTVFDFYRKQANLSKNINLSFVVFFDPKYNRNANGSNGLFTKVVHHLKNL